MRTADTLTLLLTLAAPVAAQDLIGVSWSGSVYGIDSLTAVATQLGSGLPGQNAIGRDQGGRLWSTHRTGPTGSYVYHVTVTDPITGAATVRHGNTPDLRGLAGAGGSLLYAIENIGLADSLVLFDTASGSVTPIGATGRSGLQSLAMHQGTLYAWDLSAGLMILDPATGAATDPFPGSGSSGGVQFLMSHPDGRLLAGQDDLWVVDTTTGQRTLVGSLGALDLRGAELRTGYVEAFGQSCSGASGPVALTASGPPLVGSVLATSTTNHAPQALGVLVFGLSDVTYQGTPLPAPLDPILGTSGCALHVSIDATLVGLTSTGTPGTLSFAFGVPPTGSGVLFFLQHACFEPVPGGLSWSNGLRVQVL